MSTGTGTQSDPIIAMSGDPAQIARDIRASLAHWGRTDDPYWNEKEGTPAQFSNGLWHLGHNAYWEMRMNPANTGSADPMLGRSPANISAGGDGNVILPPRGDPEPTPQSEVLAALTLARLNAIDRQLETLKTTIGNLRFPIPPIYTGSIFGYTFTLTPKP